MPSVTSGSAKRALSDGVDEVSRGRDLAAAADRRAVDGGDERERAAHQRPQHALEDGMLSLPRLVGHALAFLEVAAGAERLLASARQHDPRSLCGSSAKPSNSSMRSRPICVFSALKTSGRFKRDEENVLVTALDRQRLIVRAHPSPSRRGAHSCRRLHVQPVRLESARLV